MTHALLLAAALLNPGTPTDTFDVRIELQALYDEISQATLQFVSESDVDLFHDVLYTPKSTRFATGGSECPTTGS